MKAPDKIYITKDNKWFHTKIDETDIKYIRADIVKEIIEKIKKDLKKCLTK